MHKTSRFRDTNHPIQVEDEEDKDEDEDDDNDASSKTFGSCDDIDNDASGGAEFHIITNY